MRRMIAISLLVLGLVGGSAGAAHAGKSCPKGSRYSSGVCIDNVGGDVVKDYSKHL